MSGKHWLAVRAAGEVVAMLFMPLIAIGLVLALAAAIYVRVMIVLAAETVAMVDRWRGADRAAMAVRGAHVGRSE